VSPLAGIDDTSSRISRTAIATGTRTRASTVTSVSRGGSGVVGGGMFRVRRLAAAIEARLRAAARGVGETVTPAGWLAVGLFTTGLASGLLFGWVLGWVLAGAVGLMLVLCVPFLFGGHDYRVRLVLDRERVVAGTEVGAALEVRNAATRISLPGVVDVPIGAGLVEAQVPLLRAEGVHLERLMIAARKRGVVDIGPLSVSRGDPVGILRREMVWNEIQTLHVHPVTLPLPTAGSGLIRDLEGLPTSDVVDADLAFHAIRAYVPGDSRRHVHWKSTAKTGQLMVRQYDETRHSRIAVVFGTVMDDEYESEEEFELAVSAAASLGRQAVRDGRELVVTTSAENPEITRGATVSIRQIPTRSEQSMLDGFAEIEAGNRASRLEDVCRLTAQGHRGLSIVFIVTGGPMPVDRLRAAAQAFGTHTQRVVVRCESLAEPRMVRAGSLRIITVGALGDLAKLIARGALE